MESKKLSGKAVISLILSALLFCMPAIAFALNGSNTVEVHAEDSAESGEYESTDQSGTVSGNDAEEPESKPECICEDKCTSYEYDRNCEVCAEDYRHCAYKVPNVSISINQPSGWANTSATVTFIISDLAHTGNFEVAKIQAKVGQNGSWTDVTEDRKLEISENCTVYVLVTDQKGNTYEKSRAIRCFDTTKPTLNAAVSDGLLTIQVYDADSGVKVVYVNGYEFTDFTNGTVNIRLQQFDAGYEYFTISAMDNAGNMSDVYKTKNPYYKDPADDSDENPAAQLPVSAEATKPGSATATVTEHTETDSDGNTVSEMSKEEEKRQSMAEADAAEAAESGNSEKGKEFYTIQTATDKVFYLIIDRDGDEELVYFLTEITENDLLNVTSDNSETLPKNSAAVDSAIPTSASALPNNNVEKQEEPEEEVEEEPEEENAPEPEEEVKKEPSSVFSYILMGIIAVGTIGGAYYFKVVRKKKEDFIEDEDEEEEDTEEYEYEEEESEENPEDDFFMGDLSEEDAAETIGDDDEAPDEE